MEIVKAKKRGIIPEAWHETFPDKCECGEVLHVTPELRTTFCPNVRCKFKVIHRMVDTLTNLGVKGYGYSFCKNYIERVNTTSHLDFLIKFNEKHCPPFGLSVDFVREIDRVRKIPRTYAQVISMCELPRLKANALTLFSEVDDYNDLLKQCRNGVDRFTTASMGYTDTAEIAALTIHEFNYELSLISRIFTILPAIKKEIHIAITGRISGFSRDEYISYLNNLGKGIVGVRVSKAFESISYVVAETPSSSNTYLKGQSKGIIIDPFSLANMIVEGVERYESEQGHSED